MRIRRLLRCACLLIGCATVPMAGAGQDLNAQQMAPPTGKALVYVYRSTLYGYGVKMFVTLDGKERGQIAPKTYAMWVLTLKGVKMNETLENFFLHLAERVYNENRVSDVLYAAMNASPETFRIVADAVDLPEEANIENTEIRREVTFRIEKGTTQGELARPDFLLLPQPGTPVLIEVKLFDTDYHRDKYKRVTVDGKPPSLVLLTAREPLEDLRSHGWTIVLWDKIIKVLEAKGRTNPFLPALARYLREVTGMMNIEAVNFRKDGPKAMLYLNRLIKKVIQTYPDDDTGARSEVDTRSKGCTPEYSGYYYTLKIGQNEGARTAYIYFGIAYDDKKVGLQLWSSSHLNSQQVTDALRNHYGGKLQTGGNGHFVMLDDQKYREIFLADKPDKDAQDKVLKEFFIEFNSIVAQSL